MRTPLERPLHRRLLPLIAAALAPLSIFSAVGVLILARQQQTEVRRATIETMRALASATDNELSRHIGAAETLATSRHFDSGALSTFYEDAQRAAKSHEFWATVVVTDVSGKQLLNLMWPYGAPLPAHRDLVSVERVVRTHRPAVGNLTETHDGARRFPVRVPVLRDGRLKYILSVALQPGALLRVIERQKVPSEGVVSILDANGNHVARSRGHLEFLGHAAAPGLKALMARGPEGWGRSVTLEGQRIYAAFSRSNVTGWTVAVGIPAEEVDGALRDSYLLLGVGIALSVLLGVLALALVAKKITGPIADLSLAAQAVGRGEAPRLPDTGIQEIRQVGDALALAAEARRQAEAGRESLLKSEQNARAQAEDANRMKDEFLAMLGHELRNPLSAIGNAVRVIERGESPETARRAQEVARRQVDHLARLVDDLLDVGRVINGKILLERQPFDLAVAVMDALGTLKAAGRVEQHDISLDVRPAWVDADVTRIEQIVTNLLVNAVKYTPRAGEIAISVATEGDQAVLRVKDDGIGMSSELLPRVFDLFAQGERTLDRAQGGLGIGLTLVRRLVELHGGSVTAESDGPGRGSTFTVRLPSVAAPTAPAERAPRSARSAARNVLIVEDNEDARDMLRELLELGGHAVREAADGPGGVAAAVESVPDIALIDVGLPGLDGYEVARRIRAAYGERHVMLVALTGYGSPDDKRRALEAGFDMHLVKPIDPDMLEQVISDLPRGG